MLMKQSYGCRRVRYRGLDRNRAQLFLVCMAINLRAPTASSPAEPRRQAPGPEQEHRPGNHEATPPYQGLTASAP
jgi:hypothetical protein